jgi:putative transcriptional regulator
MTDAQVHAAAMQDPDAQPLTDEAMARMKADAAREDAAPRAWDDAEEFATRFRIPLGTLRDWEQGRVEPDQTARACLRAIAGDAAAGQRALQVEPPPPR